MTTSTPTDRLLDVHEAAERLATTPRHLRTLMETGLLPKVKLGGKNRVRESDLDALIRRGGSGEIT